VTQQNLEQVIETRIIKSRDAVKLKYFKMFCSVKTIDERLEINAKMDALNSVTRDLIRDLKNIDS